MTPVYSIYHFTFEDGNRPAGIYVGDVVHDYPAFCGRFVLKNPKWLFYYSAGYRIDIRTPPNVCLINIRTFSRVRQKYKLMFVFFRPKNSLILYIVKKYI